MRPTLWGGAALLVAAAACEDVVSIPGACPEFCPQGEIVVRDTVLANSVEAVGSYVGYKLAFEAAQLQIVGPGSSVESRALIVFRPFASLYAGSDTSVGDTIRQTDSLSFLFNLVRRTDVSGIELALHSIPALIDSNTTFDDMTPFFDDSTLIANYVVPDSQTADSVVVTVPLSAIPSITSTGFQTAIGVRIRSAAAAFISVSSAESDSAPLIRRYVRVDSTAGAVQVTRTETLTPFFDTFVLDTAGVAPPPGALFVGGIPAARAFLKLNVPSGILDSTLIVRATLLIQPPHPVFGAPGDQFRVRVHALGADFGPKSPLVITELDTATVGSAVVVVGSQDSIGIDITNILRNWSGNVPLPHTVMLRLVPEAGSIGLLQIADPGIPSPATIQVTYGLPFRPPGR